MLVINIPETEVYDESKNSFVVSPAITIELEHSLVSLSKWESTHKKPFLSEEGKSVEETRSYARIMTLTPNVSPEVYLRLNGKHVQEISDYINDSMTATWFREDGKVRPNKQIVTSELIYYWMTALQIPIEAENWHLNRLITLVKVCNEKNKPADKRNRMSNSERSRRMAEINAANRARAGSRG